MSLDFTQLFNPQPTPYPVNPIVQLLQGLFAVKQFQQAQRREQEQRTLLEGERKRQQLMERWNLLNAQIQRYVSANQQPPQPLLAALNEVEQGLGGAGMEQTMLGGQPATVAPPQGPFGESQASGPGVGPAQLGSPQAAQQFKYPMAPDPTLGEMAQAVGLRLRQGVNPNLKRSQVPQGVDIGSLFEDPRAEARARLEQLLKNYSIQQIRSNPALLKAFTELNAQAGGVVQTEGAMPTGQIQYQPTGREPKAGEPAGVLTIPTGPTQQVPIAPEVPPERVALLNVATGQITMIELPPGASLRTFTPPGQPPRHAIVDRNGNIIQILPPGVQPHFQPKPGGEGAASVGPPLALGVGQAPVALDVRPVRNKQGIVTHYSINGAQYTVQQAQAQAEQWFAAGDPRGRALAGALGASPKLIAQWEKKYKSNPAVAAARKQYDALAMQHAALRAQMQALTAKRINPRDPGYIALEQKLRAVVAKMAVLLRRFPQLNQSGQTTAQEDPLGILK